MSLLVLTFLLLISVGMTTSLDSLPELVMGWLSPPRWLGWLCLAATIAWLTGE
ncbi:hypothetical protein [Sphaerothrix gracilis]|uniref:hypothetical protein n=1 Tax=Sphaerothrix gracilis TaxID=3151835 RepID=UPI0031FD2FDC